MLHHYEIFSILWKVALVEARKLSDRRNEEVKKIAEDCKMGNLNFQDEENAKSQQPNQSASNSDDPRDDPKLEDIFVDENTSGVKFLWAAVIVIVIAGLAGGVYLLNKHGYLHFSQKQHASETVNESAPPPPAPSSRESASIQSAGKFTLQIAAFKEKRLADDFAARMKKKGIDTYVSSENEPSNEKWFKVCTGSFDTKLLAIAATQGMKKKVGTDVWVVPTQ